MSFDSPISAVDLQVIKGKDHAKIWNRQRRISWAWRRSGCQRQTLLSVCVHFIPARFVLSVLGSVDPLSFNRDFNYEMRIVDVQNQGMVAQYVFPINPQNITINTQPSTTLEATMKGIYENHNGAVFRAISISGTTGTNVIPATDPPNGAKTSSTIGRTLDYAFQNTIRVLQAL